MFSAREYEGARATAKPPMPMVDIAMAAWPVDGLDGLMARQLPTHMRGDALPSTAWRAHALWHNTSYLASIIPPLRIYGQSGRGASFVFADGSMRARVDTPREIHHLMPLQDVIERSTQRLSETLYTAANLHKLGAAVSKDVEPLSAFRCADCGGSSDSVLWLQTGRAETHAHYDQSHNVFVQVVGRKHVTLWPPSSHERLRFLPRLHSLARQSSLHDPRHAATALSYQATLEEGDALYIPPVGILPRAGDRPDAWRVRRGPPCRRGRTHAHRLLQFRSPHTRVGEIRPRRRAHERPRRPTLAERSPRRPAGPQYWAHHMRSLSEVTISFGTWSDSAEQLTTAGLSSRARPWQPTWSTAQNVRAVARYVHLLLRHAYRAAADPCAAAREALARAVLNRYEALRRYPHHEQEGLLPLERDLAASGQHAPPHAACGSHSEDADAASAEAHGSAQEAIGALGEQTAAAGAAETDTSHEATTAELDSEVLAAAQRIAEVVGAASADESVREIVLGDYLEELARFVAGREGAHASLRCVGEQLASCEGSKYEHDTATGRFITQQ